LLINENNELYEELIDLHGSESAQILAKWIEEGLVKSIHSNEPTLADIFVEVTGRELS
jgi:ABC-2 type transport system ATP-binding protein